jgi:hypothetical protein
MNQQDQTNLRDAASLPFFHAFPSALLEGWRRTFVNRSQPYAVQQADGTYRWRQERCGLDVLVGHLSGASTLALASTDVRGWCKWVWLDADAPDALPPLVALAGWLAADGLPGVLEASRRGGHLWLLFDEAVPALAARSTVRDALDRAAAAGLPLPALELYPDRAAGGLGHAMRLPLGVHRRTQRRYPLLDQVGTPLPGGVQVGANYLIEGAPRVQARLVQARWERNIHGALEATMTHPTMHSTARRTTIEADSGPRGAAEERPRAAASASTENGLALASSFATHSGVIRWVDTHVSPLRVLDELAPGCAPHRSGQGYLGWCPFHDDRGPDADGRPGSPSFYVVHNARYGWSWRCLSPNCLQHAGPMRHTFRLFQELLRLDVPAAIRAAAARWPEATAGVP